MDQEPRICERCGCDDERLSKSAASEALIPFVAETGLNATSAVTMLFRSDSRDILIVNVYRFYG